MIKTWELRTSLKFSPKFPNLSAKPDEPINF